MFGRQKGRLKSAEIEKLDSLHLVNLNIGNLGRVRIVTKGREKREGFFRKSMERERDRGNTA